MKLMRRNGHEVSDYAGIKKKCQNMAYYAIAAAISASSYSNLRIRQHSMTYIIGPFDVEVHVFTEPISLSPYLF